MTMLQEAKRRATVAVLTQAAQQGLMSAGLALTVDDVAEIAGVSRSTVFRHFASREDLFATAIASGGKEFKQKMPDFDGADWRAWLHQLCEANCVRTAETWRGLWDLSGRRDVPPQIQDAMRRIEESRRRWFAAIAKTLWEACGGSGPVSPTITNVVAAHMSPIFTLTVLTDVEGADGQLAARVAESCIAAAMVREFPAEADRADVRRAQTAE